MFLPQQLVAPPSKLRVRKIRFLFSLVLDFIASLPSFLRPAISKPWGFIPNRFCSRPEPLQEEWYVEFSSRSRHTGQDVLLATLWTRNRISRISLKVAFGFFSLHYTEPGLLITCWAYLDMKNHKGSIILKDKLSDWSQYLSLYSGIGLGRMYPLINFVSGWHPPETYTVSLLIKLLFRNQTDRGQCLHIVITKN